MMHASFQTGCHDSIGLNAAWEDSGFVLSRTVTDGLEHVHLLTFCPNRDAAVLPPEPCKGGSDPILVKAPLKVAV